MKTFLSVIFLLSSVLVQAQAPVYRNLKDGECMRKWLILDPIPIKLRSGKAPKQSDHLKIFKGIMPAANKVEATIESGSLKMDRKLYTWNVYETEFYKVTVPYEKHAFTYAYAEIESPINVTMNFGVGAEEGMIIWVNGRRVLRHWETVAGRIVDNKCVPFRLVKGKNRILIRLQHQSNAWAFTVRPHSGCREFIAPDPVVVEEPVEEVVEVVETDSTVVEEKVETPVEEVVEAPVEKIEEVVKPTIPEVSSILFAYDSYALTAEAKKELNALATALNKNSTWKVTLSGHTDVKGGNQYNQQLSVKRAEAAKKYLVAQGVSASRISTSGLSTTKLLKGATDQENRRVEILIYSL